MTTRTLSKRQWEIIRMEKSAGAIKEHAPGKNIFTDILPALFEFHSLERKLQKLAELSCNGYPRPVVEYREGKMFRYDEEDDAVRERSEKREIKLEGRVRALALEYGLSVDFQGDPRGLMFSLKTVDGVEVSF